MSHKLHERYVPAPERRARSWVLNRIRQAEAVAFDPNHRVIGAYAIKRLVLAVGDELGYDHPLRVAMAEHRKGLRALPGVSVLTAIAGMVASNRHNNDMISLHADLKDQIREFPDIIEDAQLGTVDIIGAEKGQIGKAYAVYDIAGNAADQLHAEQVQLAEHFGLSPSNLLSPHLTVYSSNKQSSVYGVAEEMRAETPPDSTVVLGRAQLLPFKATIVNLPQ